MNFEVVCVKKHELLVPAGDMECLRQAVFHGADAVYLACKNFGARKFASNFTNEEIIEAIQFCHLYGVKIYVTMNTLVYNDEVDSFLEQAKFLHQNGVDALIVQDFGMICLLREKFPNLEIHASTQANNSSVETCEMFYNLGVKRVVFSRELSIDEIDHISVPIEKEAFIHGALCVSYSGCCLMSSMLGGRSGNRGECAGCCRLPYSLYEKEKRVRDNCYLLSMKELNTSSMIQRLLDSSVYSFKIEGRMKGPLYVAFITEFYRQLLDGEEISFEEKTKQLMSIFNREFTLGHMFGVEGNSLINSKTPNHIGLQIGTASVTGKKIKIQLDSSAKLHQHDSIRFLHSNKGMVVNYLYDKKDNLCSSSNTICYVDNKVELKNEDIVMKTQDSLLEKEYLLNEVKRKVPITYSVCAKKNDTLKITMSDGENVFSAEGVVVSEAKSMPLTQDDIGEKLSKLGGTPFIIQSINFEMDDRIFIPIKEINELRRQLVEKMIDARKNKKIEFVEKVVSFEKMNHNYQSGYTCYVHNEEQFQTCLKYPFIRIYTSSFELYSQYKDKYPIYFFPGRCQKKYSLVEHNIFGDNFLYEGDCFGNYFLNITNIYSAYYFQRNGLKNIPLSVELSVHQIEDFMKQYEEKFGNACFEIFGYGRVENMILKGNILDLAKNSFDYSIMDQKNRRFPVFYDGNMTHIYNFEKREKTYLLNHGCCFLFDFYDEDSTQIVRILNSVMSEKVL